MFGFKRYNYDAFTKDVLIKDAALDRFSGPNPGDSAPEFEGRTLTGDNVDLSDFRGQKNVVLTFGSATCPFTAATMAGMNELFDEFNGEDVQFLFCYVREAHPGEKLPAHDSTQDKIRAAELLRDEEGIDMPILVDDLKGTIHRRYGKLPNSTFIIDKSGRVAFRALWTNPSAVEDALEELLQAQEERGVDHAVVQGGEYARMPSVHAMLHTHRALERGGRRAIYDFNNEMGMPGRLAVQGSKLVQPIAEHPVAVVSTVALAAAVITGGVFLGKWLRRRRFERRTPYDIQDYGQPKKTDDGSYEAVGI